MIGALIGLFGVLVGVFLSQVFTAVHESRTKRLDALVSIVAASGRMIGAYERLFELFEGGTSPPLHEERVVQVTTERLQPVMLRCRLALVAGNMCALAGGRFLIKDYPTAPVTRRGVLRQAA